MKANRSGCSTAYSAPILAGTVDGLTGTRPRSSKPGRIAMTEAEKIDAHGASGPFKRSAWSENRRNGGAV